MAACYGYTLERQNDGSGRRFTVAVVNEQEAPVVRRIFVDYLAGRGQKAIAHQLNNEGVTAPSAEIPEWRIVDDAIWFAVNEMFTTRGPSRNGRPASKYPLTGIAKCGSCGGAVGAARSRAYGTHERALCYGCAKHHERGSAVCSVTVHQPMVEVEDAFIEYLQQHVLSDAVMQLVLAEIRTEIAAQLPQQEADIAALETELTTARSEQKRLAKAVAMADDVPELVSELRKRSARIAHLDAQIMSAKRTPDDLVALVTRIETSARARLHHLKTALADRRDLREVFLSLFPDGLTFTPARSPDGERQLWRIAGTANLSSLLGPVGPDCVATPTGFEGVENTQQCSANALNLLKQAARELHRGWPEVQVACRALLQAVSAYLAVGDVKRAQTEMDAMIAAMTHVDEPEESPELPANVLPFPKVG